MTDLTLYLFVVVVLNGCGAQQRTDGPSFQETRIEVGAAPGSVLPLDVNEDQVLDLVVANNGDGTITILLGDGAGRFPQRITLDAGENPEDLAAGDFDEDGRSDLVVANHETDYVTLLFGGTEGFERRDHSQLTVDVSPHPHRVSVADVDEDGHLDLLVDDPTGEALRVYRGRGDGTFVESKPIRLRGNPFYGIAVRDLNGDGHLDVATHNGIAVGDGTGSFSGGPELQGPRGGPFGVAVADVNGDDIPDIGLGSGQRESAFAIWLGSSGGVFAPEPASVRPIADGPTRVVASDVDGDSIQDFVITSYTGNELTILFGGQHERRMFRMDIEGNPWAVATGDFNSDGRMDIVTANQRTNDISILTASE